MQNTYNDKHSLDKLLSSTSNSLSLSKKKTFWSQHCQNSGSKSCRPVEKHTSVQTEAPKCITVKSKPVFSLIALNTSCWVVFCFYTNTSLSVLWLLTFKCTIHLIIFKYTFIYNNIAHSVYFYISFYCQSNVTDEWQIKGKRQLLD